MLTILILKNLLMYVKDEFYMEKCRSLGITRVTRVIEFQTHKILVNNNYSFFFRRKFHNFIYSFETQEIHLACASIDQ